MRLKGDWVRSVEPVCKRFEATVIKGERGRPLRGDLPPTGPNLEEVREVELSADSEGARHDDDLECEGANSKGEKLTVHIVSEATWTVEK
jgi:hypothetical protein